MRSIALLGTTLGLGFVSGVNLYAAILTVGLCLRFHLIHLHPELQQLNELANPYVLGAAALVYVVEFFADKIPWVDSLWDAFHTFIRPIGAVILGATALGHIDPVLKTGALVLCGGIAFSSHATKAGARIATNHSPEPFSNIGLSLLEDTLATGGVYASLTHPLIVLVLCIAFLIFFALVAPILFRLISLEYAAVSSLLRMYVRRPGFVTAVASGGSAMMTGYSGSRVFQQMPDQFNDYWERQHGAADPQFRVRCAAGKGIRGLRHCIGYMHVLDGRLVFITKKTFRFHAHQVSLSDIQQVQFRKGLLMDTVVLKAKNKRQVFHFFKSRENHGQKAATLIQP